MGAVNSPFCGRSGKDQHHDLPVVLHVYDCGPVVAVCNEAARPFGTGAFHCGVEVLQSPLAAAYMPDPRALSLGGGSTVGVIGFFFPNKQEPCDELCKAGFCATWWDVSPDSIELEVPRNSGAVHRFSNAAAAFEAFRFPSHAREFEPLSGTAALKLKMELHGKEDSTYGGYHGAWSCMLNILRAKFKPHSWYAHQLLRTENNFLLHHRSEHKGEDQIWSDGFRGTGKNLIGLQLMIVRDELSSRSTGRWTSWIHSFIDIESGEIKSKHWSSWHDAVHVAATLLVEVARAHSSTKEVRVDPHSGMVCTQEQLRSFWARTDKKRSQDVETYWEIMCVPLQEFSWEWSFCASDVRQGVFRCPPRKCDFCGPYRESVVIGRTNMTKEEFSLLIHELGMQYPSNRYDLLTCNCTHFSDMLCKKLGAGSIPGWVQKLASELVGCRTAMCKGPASCFGTGGQQQRSKFSWAPPPEVLTSEALLDERDPWDADPRFPT